jgi:hypothetical protein
MDLFVANFHLFEYPSATAMLQKTKALIQKPNPRAKLKDGSPHDRR